MELLDIYVKVKISNDKMANVERICSLYGLVKHPIHITDDYTTLELPVLTYTTLKTLL